MKSLTIIPALFLWLLASCGGPSSSDSVEKADAIYYGGDIITMEGDSPVYAEAVAIRGGKIVLTGARSEAEKLKGDSTEMVDLKGQTLLPGFIDGHGHLFNAGIQALAGNLLPPPDGNGVSMDSLIAITRNWADANERVIRKIGWIVAFGYDDAQLKEKRHPEASDLDRISTEVPVMLIHQSGHLAAVNSKGLELAGYTDGVADPNGGIIRRIKGTRKPNGTLEETAMFAPLFQVFNKFDSVANEVLVKAGIEAYTRYGFTTAQEGRATKAICETYRNMAAKGMLGIDVYAYPDIQMEMDYVHSVGTQRDYTNHFRIAGVKLSTDGSPQGKTAWLTKPYKVPPPGAPADYAGYPAIPDRTEMDSLVSEAYKNNWQIITHCNGDAAADAYIRAVRLAADAFGNNDRRSVMIHAQVVREDQLDSMKALGIIPSFFSMHTYYWGDWHRDETLGKERAYRISPTASALRRGMKFSEHHDAPVAKPDALRVLHSTVNRVSRSGDVIGPDQRVSVFVGLKSITEWAAYQCFEENLKGTLTPGKLADFVILDKNPLKIDPIAIADLKVMATIKEGKTVYTPGN